MYYVLKSDSGYYSPSFTWTDSQSAAKRYTPIDKARLASVVGELFGPSARFVKVVPRQPF